MAVSSIGAHLSGPSLIDTRAGRCAALDEAGVQYEIVKEMPLLRWRRKTVIAGTGQSRLPAIQLEDGSWYRSESG